MKNLSALLMLIVMLVTMGCGKLGKKSAKGLPNDGMLHGVAPGSKYNLSKPPGMVYIPPGTFHMGPSDEDVNFTYKHVTNKYPLMDFGWTLQKSPTINTVSL